MSETVRDLVVSLSVDSGNAEKDLKGLQNAVKLADAKFKEAGAGIEDFENSSAGMAAQVERLNSRLQAQQGIVDRASAALEKAKTRAATNAASQQKLAQKIEATKAAYQAEVAASGKDSEASKALAAELSKLEGQYAAQTKAATSAAQAVQKGEVALSNAKAAVKETEADLKKATEGLKKHSDAWVNAGAKMQEVGGKMSSAGSKIESAGKKWSQYITAPVLAAGVLAFKTWQDVDNGVDEIIARTGAKGAELEMLETVFTNVFSSIKTSADEAGTAVGEIYTRFGVQGTDLENMTRLFIQFSEITHTDLTGNIADASRIMSQYGIEAGDAADFLGDLLEASQQTGITTSDLMALLDEAGGTLRLLGFSASDAVTWLSNMHAAGVDGETAMTALKTAASRMAEEGIPLRDGLGQAINAIVAAKDETTALQIATELFGAKGAVPMMDAIRSGRLALTDFGTVIVDNSKLVADTYAAMNDDTKELDLLKQQLQLTAADIGESLLPWISAAASKVSAALTWFSNLDDATKNTAATIVGAFAIGGPIIWAIGKTAESIGEITTAMGKVVSSKNIALLSSALSNPVTWGIAAGVGVLALIGYIEGLPSQIDGIVSSLASIKINIDEDSKNATLRAIAEVKAAADALSGEKSQYYKGTSAAVEAGYGTSTMFGTAIEYERASAEKYISDFSALYSAEINDLNAQIAAAVQNGDLELANQLRVQRDDTQMYWDMDVQAEKDYFTDRVEALVNGMMLAQPEAKAAMEQAAKQYDLMTMMEQAMSSNADEMGGEAWAALQKNIVAGLTELGYGDKFDLASPLSTLLESVRPQLMEDFKKNIEFTNKGELAYTLLNTLLSADGVTEMIDFTSLQGALDGIVESLDYKQAATKAENAEKTSQFGEYLTQGLADGIINNAGTVSGTMTEIRNAVVESLKSAFDMHSPSQLMAGYGVNVTKGFAQGVLSGQSIAVSAVASVYKSMIDEANKWRPILNNAMGWASGGGSYGGGGHYSAQTKNYSFGPALQTGPIIMSSPLDVQALMSEAEAIQRRQRAGYGYKA